MNKLLIPAITGVLILGGIGLSYDAFAASSVITWESDTRGTATLTVEDDDYLGFILVESSRHGNQLMAVGFSCEHPRTTHTVSFSYPPQEGFDVTVWDCPQNIVTLTGQGVTTGNDGTNNGDNGCEKSNPNSKACEQNPNSVSVTIDPTSGPVGTAFTITDPEGRIQSGDTVTFFLEGTDPSDYAPADNVSVSADGTTITGNVPLYYPSGEFLVHVGINGFHPERFEYLSFTITAP